MTILVLAPRFPYPLDKGDRLTVYHLLKYFSEKGHRVIFACFLEPGQDPAWVEKVAPFCHRVEVLPLRRSQAYLNCLTGLAGKVPLQAQYYRSAAMSRMVKRLIEESGPDLLYAHTIRMARYIEPYLQHARVLAMQISMTLNYRRLVDHASNGLMRLLFWTEYRKVRRFEAEIARRFDKVLLISKHDVGAIEQGDTLDNVFLSPHGVDFTRFSPDPSVKKEPRTVVLTGNMNYAPNVDAALYLCKDILPLVRQRVPDVKLWLVGANPAAEVSALADGENVQVTGRVPDLRTYLNRAEVALAPIRIGAGLQNKVLEGMSMGLPMVVTSVANEGIQARARRDVEIGDSAEDFALRIVELLGNADRRRELGESAREFIVNNWSWEKHFGDLERMFVELVGDSQRS